MSQVVLPGRKLTYLMGLIKVKMPLYLEDKWEEELFFTKRIDENTLYIFVYRSFAF